MVESISFPVKAGLKIKPTSQKLTLLAGNTALCSDQSRRNAVYT